MRNKNQFKLLVFLTAIVMMLSGCNIHNNSYGTDYAEYFSYMKPYLDKPRIHRWDEGDRIRIFMEHGHSDEDSYYDTFFGVLDAHNAFVDDNSAYFDRNNLCIVYGEVLAGEIFQFSNTPDFFFYGTSVNLSEISYENDGSLCYCMVNYDKIAYTSLWPEGDCLEEVKVICIDISRNNGSKFIPSDFSFLATFPNLEKVVFSTNWEYDETESFYDEVMNEYPSLEIYTRVLGSDELIQQEHE